MSKPKALLITHPARLGDTILSIPLHRTLAQNYDLHSNAGEPYRFLFQELEGQITFTDPQAPKSIGEISRRAKELHSQKFQTAFILRPSFRSALLCKLAKIPERVGECTEGRGFLLTHKLPYSPDLAEFERMDKFAQLVGLGTDKTATLPASPESIAKAQEALQGATIGIVPGGTWPQKLIPTETLRKTIHHLVEQGHKVAMLGGPGDEIYCSPFKKEPLVDLVAKFKLNEMAGVLKSLKLLITPDGGLSHYSVACGTPALIAFGPTPHKRWGYHIEPHKTIVAPGSQMERLTWQEFQPHVDEMLAKIG
jgi:ADP-heptose:LPS heptosyltransferase